jgi:hypothetical protein
MSPKKRIEQHTDTELDIAIAAAVTKFGNDFWLMLHGIDAYMERRKRRDDRAQASICGGEDLADPWGSS